MTKAKPIKVPVTERALLQRINRIEAKQDRKVCKSRPFYDGERGPYYDQTLGEFYCLDTSRNNVAFTHIDLEKHGREIGALKPYETLVSEEE